MHLEIEAAVKFLMKILSLKNTLKADQLDSLGKNLACVLRDRYQGHWYPDKPARGQAYRCIRINKWQYVDESLLQACTRSGLEYSRLPLPREFTMWIDPFEVCGRIGENRDYFTIATFKPVCKELVPVCPEQVNEEPVPLGTEEPVLVSPEQMNEEPVEQVNEDPVPAGPEQVAGEPVEHVNEEPEQITEEPVELNGEPVPAGPEQLNGEPVPAGPEQVNGEPVEHLNEEPVPVSPEQVNEEPVPLSTEEPVLVPPEQITEEPVEQVNEDLVPAGPEQVTEEPVLVYLECETSDYSSDGLSSESEFVSENSSDEETERVEKVVMPPTCTSPDEAIDSPSTSKAGTPVNELLAADQETDDTDASVS